MNGETPEQFTARMMDKADAQRRFSDQDHEAVLSAKRPRAKSQPRPKSQPRTPRAPRQPRPPIPHGLRRRDARPDFCRCCARPLRARDQPASPETRAHGGKGFCVSCYRRGGKPPKPYGVQQGDPCCVCGVPMFTQRNQPEPGQKRHTGRGQCSTCYNRMKKAA